MKQEIIDENSYDRNANTYFVQKRIPKATVCFVFGLISCIPMYGLMIPFGILAVVFASKGFKLLESDYQAYKKEKWKILVGRITGWVGIGINGMYAIIFIFALMAGGFSSASRFDNYNDSYYDDYEYPSYEDEYYEDEYDNSNDYGY